MASTTGGFLIGIGLCILLICFGGFQVIEAYSEEVETAQYYANQMYQTTHSSTYLGIMDAMDTISPYTSELANVLNNPLIAWTGLGWLGDPIKQISLASSMMMDIYVSSEQIYVGMQVLEIAPEYLIYGMIAGGVLFIVGVILVFRASRK